jgi:hypothetical protein
MGLFDGVKEAFGADGMGELDGDRETPIDRWMGWNAKRDDGMKEMGNKGEFEWLRLECMMCVPYYSERIIRHLYSSFPSLHIDSSTRLCRLHGSTELHYHLPLETNGYRL